MTRPVVLVEPDGPGVDVVDNVRLSTEGRFVGLIAMPKVGRGWTELTPDQAEQVGLALIRAAHDTRNPR